MPEQSENLGQFPPVYRTMVGGKIHRATVTGADLNYVGSISVDSELLEAADIYPGQQVDVVNVTNGSRLTTYTIAAPSGSGTIQLNGAAAHLTKAGDIVIIIAYLQVPEPQALVREPRVVLVDGQNHPIKQGQDLSA